MVPCNAETIRVINETNADAYITTAYYRPVLKRIDSDFPVENIQKIAPHKILDIEKPIKKGVLYKPRIFIAASTKEDLDFLEETVNKKKEMESLKKNLTLRQRFNNPALKQLEEDLEKLEKKILTALTYTITDDKTYILKIDSNNKLIMTSKKELINTQSPSQESFIAHSKKPMPQSKNSEIKIISNGDEPIKKNVTTNEAIQKEPIQIVEEPKKVTSQEVTNERIPAKEKIVKNKNREEPKQNRDTQPFPIETIPTEDASSTQGILDTAWTTVAKIKSANQSWIINGTGEDLEINQVHSKIFNALPSPTTESITIADKKDHCLTPLDINFLKWRYLLHRKPREDKWNSLWMWPVWDAYIFDQNNKVHTYSYAKSNAIIIKDITVKETVYVAVYKHTQGLLTKGKGALRVTPIIAIEESEVRYEVPYFSNYEQFGYRQLIIAPIKESLAVDLDEEAYATFTKKNIPLSIGQPSFNIAKGKDKSLELYSHSEWKNKMKQLPEPTNPVSLGWLDTFIFGRLEKGAEVLRQRMFNN